MPSVSSCWACARMWRTSLCESPGTTARTMAATSLRSSSPESSPSKRRKTSQSDTCPSEMAAASLKRMSSIPKLSCLARSTPSPLHCFIDCSISSSVTRPPPSTSIMVAKYRACLGVMLGMTSRRRVPICWGSNPTPEASCSRQSSCSESLFTERKMSIVSKSLAQLSARCSFPPSSTPTKVRRRLPSAGRKTFPALGSTMYFLPAMICRRSRHGPRDGAAGAAPGPVDAVAPPWRA